MLAWVGYPPKSARILLTFAAAPGRGDYSVGDSDPVWGRHPYVERSAADVLRHALCKVGRKTVQGDGSGTDSRLVGQYLSRRLWLCCLLHQTLDPASISSNLRTHSQR